MIIGLTGGIGSGKTTVADFFIKLGIPVIDTDHISQQLTQAGGLAIPIIQQHFGSEFIHNKALNKPAMRQLIFSSPAAKKQLEQILHPLILKQTQQQLSQPVSAPYQLLVVPLLFECPAFLALCQRVLLIDCEEKTQITRVKKRSQLDEKTIRAIIASQTSRKERLAKSDDIIFNQNNISQLQKQVEQLHKQYLAASVDELKQNQLS